ncbi:serine/threonine-protein kinase HAL4/sat4 [Saitoella coloradoensis]
MSGGSDTSSVASSEERDVVPPIKPSSNGIKNSGKPSPLSNEIGNESPFFANFSAPTSRPSSPTKEKRLTPGSRTESATNITVQAPTAVRPSVIQKKSLLNRMFSQTGRKEREAEKAAEKAEKAERKERERLEKEKEKQEKESENGGSPDPEHSRIASPADISQSGTPTGTKEPHVRFKVLPDGNHVHRLKNTKRQEKLKTMFDAFMMGGSAKKKEEERRAEDERYAAEEAATLQMDRLSLLHNWVDTLKSEQKLAKEQKNGPNATAGLVEKYGKCQEIVGRGAFGIVRIAHKPDPADPRKEQLYAIKEFRRRPAESVKKYTKRLTSEFCISSSLRHPNVIHTLDLVQDAKGDYCEVMEFCAGGDLYSLILAAGKLEMEEADCYFKQLMRGVEYMHEMGVAHRDLKPENLLLTPQGALKITDFGNGECFRMAWEKEAHMTCGLCGSAPYIAPEEYTDKEFDPRAVDIWACGVIYMAMRTGRHLWRVAKKDEDEFFAKYLDGRKSEEGYEPIESLHRSRCRNVIYSILDPNPARRITGKQILRSEFINSINICKAGEFGI